MFLLTFLITVLHQLTARASPKSLRMVTTVTAYFLIWDWLGNLINTIIIKQTVQAILIQDYCYLDKVDTPQLLQSGDQFCL